MPARSRTVSSTWRGAYLCDITAGEFSLRADEPVSVGGTNEGPQPTELLLASVSSCFTLAVAHAARVRGIELGHLEVDVTGTYDGPRFTALDIRVDVGCDPAVREKLLEAAQRVCYVTNTLRTEPALTVTAA